MSLILTNDQIKNVSRDILLIPAVINDPVKGLTVQRQKIIDQKAIYLVNDNDKVVFYNFWKSVILSYHSEINYLNASTYTEYSDTDLNNGGKETGNHFPSSPIWILFAPKQLASMYGSPISSNGTDIEPDIISRLNYDINFIKNGFSDGSTSQSVTAVTNNSFDFGAGVTPTIGHKFIINNLTNSVHGEITNVVGTVASFIYIAGVAGSVVGSGTYKNFHNGFTQNERIVSGPLNYANDVLVSYKNFIATEIANWSASVNSQISLLNNIGDYPPRKASNDTALISVNSVAADIASWLALALTGAGSRYSDTGLLILTSRSATRTSAITTRISDIAINLGSISVQDSNGDFTGSGVYYELAVIIGLRISRAAGSLTQYNRSDLGVKVFDKKIADANDQLTQYQLVMAVAKATTDIDIGQFIIPVNSVTDFSIGDSVKIFDNDSNVYDRMINGISGLNITLDSGLLVQLQISKLARIIKLK